ncbi:Exodeoxyribonuclease VII small subunit [invertebrate metagenome]|uniref:Exodeoxyribonuclease VII small subunit n=1 Tax=invertebrate metagenome TaxID=1711999 RepID=A0A484H757_9ZZZZ
MTSDSLPTDITAMDFEDAMAALEDIVRRLEGGRIRLEEAVVAYERGVALKRHCEVRLKEAKIKVECVTTGSEGQTALTGEHS